MGGHLGPGLLEVHRDLLAQHHVVVDAVLDVRVKVGHAENALVVGFVLGEEQRHLALAVQGVLTHYRMRRGNCSRARRSLDLLEVWFP